MVSADEDLQVQMLSNLHFVPLPEAARDLKYAPSTVNVIQSGLP